MPDRPAPEHWWIFHAGALGDFILTWPLLRALAANGHDLSLTAQPSHAALAARELLISTHSGEHPRFARLWTGDPSATPIPGVTRIISFLADDSTPAGRAWLTAAASLFPGAAITPIGPPGAASRHDLWLRTSASTIRGHPRPLHNPTGPIILHTGAGSRAKRWPMDRWLALAAHLRIHPSTRAHDIHLLAGHVEREQFTADETRAFRAAAGRYIDDDLPALTETLRTARLTIAADTGPAHLAAQLGIPTLTLFGPTDPTIWSPIGPTVRTLAPLRTTTAADMTWLDPGATATATLDLLALSTPH